MKKAIVVGATSGIGRSLASILVAEQYRVGVTGRRKEELDAIRAENPEHYVTGAFDGTRVNNSGSQQGKSGSTDHEPDKEKERCRLRNQTLEADGSPSQDTTESNL